MNKLQRKLRVLIHESLIFIANHFVPTATAAACGHKTRRYGKIISAKDQLYYRPFASPPKRQYCLKCIERMQIRCAWCGQPILIGMNITLHQPAADESVPSFAVSYISSGETSFIGCCRSTCLIESSEQPSALWSIGEDGHGKVDLSGYRDWIPGRRFRKRPSQQNNST